MRKMLLVLSIIFSILTFVGASYVLFRQGQVNAGYAVVPMVISIVFLTVYRNRSK